MVEVLSKCYSGSFFQKENLKNVVEMLLSNKLGLSSTFKVFLSVQDIFWAFT